MTDDAQAAAALARIDSYPYRHRLAEVMTAPVASVASGATLAEAAAEMDRRDISSVLVTGPGTAAVAGIVTERDVLRALARHGAASLSLPVEMVMGRPLQSLPATAFVYRALGRMDRCGIRHLAVTGADGAVIGIVTARALLKQRAGRALALGDGIAVADAAGLGGWRGELPGLAAALTAEGVPGRQVAAVISETIRDLTARAAVLAAEELAAGPLGPAPAAWCVMVLGSGGRGESLLVPDQDNALIHAGGEADDAWFAAFGARIADLLDAAGVPYCKGGVMAREALWRHSRQGWRDTVAGWIARPQGESLLNVDIFFDLMPVAGDAGLAEALRADALALARGARSFLANLAGSLDPMRPPLGFFGGIRTEAGRADLKLGGLLPLVSGARVLALKAGSAATSTPGRLADAHAAGLLNEADMLLLDRSHTAVVEAVLAQQIADIAAGIAPSTRVATAGLPAHRRSLLRLALEAAGRVPEIVREGLSG
ncbi:MAG: hypothetical protein OHK0024_07100 [Thalassobaculales bacterium]